MSTNNIKYFFPIHLDGGNRGCEGIAKGTAKILGLSKAQLVGLCTNISLDERLGTSKYYTLVPIRRETVWYKIANKLFRMLKSFRTTDKFELSSYNRHYLYHPFVKAMKKGDIMLSTGGDMMCYGDNLIITTNNLAKKRGAKTILWGCSMGKENLTPRKLETLKRFDLVYARETLSFEFFKSLGLLNVVCYPDPAFALDPEIVELPMCFEKNKVIGINLSNYTVGAYSLDTPFGEEVKQLVDYILNETDYHILLIPHVMWKDQDDRIIAKNVADTYGSYKDRFSVLDSEKYNYLQIRYIISKCYIFIGGRTHAVVSAYSTCVPAIALGYSIKSKGVAKDLGMPEYTVVDSKMVTEKGKLKESFCQLCHDYQVVKDHLDNFIPSYRERTKEIKEIVK